MHKRLDRLTALLGYFDWFKRKEGLEKVLTDLENQEDGVERFCTYLENMDGSKTARFVRLFYGFAVKQLRGRAERCGEAWNEGFAAPPP
ncbi:MAG: hypothetical protein IPP17_30385 [Bacteroidetes bacterium]|nr:hypothetical protein [Bacteroidota bacterium]